MELEGHVTGRRGAERELLRQRSSRCCGCPTSWLSLGAHELGICPQVLGEGSRVGSFWCWPSMVPLN